MPIGSGIVYNTGDLILSQVSGSGTAFLETKIAAATSSLIYFDNTARINSASLNSITVGTSSFVSGSTSIITNLTASNISSSGIIRTNQITASSIIANNGPLIITGSNAYLQMFPVGGSPIPSNTTASYIYTSGSTNDMYFTQYNGAYTNTTRLRWLEGNLYTGILYGGVLSSTPGSNTFNVTTGEGIIVQMNAFTSSAPYPTVKLVSWPNYTNQPITYSGSAKITYVGLDVDGKLIQQTNAWGSSNINQWDDEIFLGVVLTLSGSTSTGVFNSPQVSYANFQQTDDFLRAFGPLKISGHTLQASGSNPTLSIKKTGGTAYREGANYTINPNHPSTVVENDVNVSKIYRYYLSGSTPVIDTGIANAGYTTIDNDKYVNISTGTLTTVGNSNWSIQRVFWVPNSPTNAFIVYYGNATYATLIDAVNAKDSEPFTEAPNTATNSIFIGYIIIEGGTGRSLLNPAECTIIQGGLFRNVGGIGSSGTSPVSTALAGLSDVALSDLHDGDLLVYNGGQWNNNKTLQGNYVITGSLGVQSGITGNLTGTSSWATNALTASAIAGVTNAFIQDGNSFGTTATLGTNDAQPLAFETSGSERLRITSTGNVGIGTTVPSSSLHVRNLNSGDQTLLVLEHAAGYSVGTENRLDFYDDESHKVASRIAQYYTGEANNRWGLKLYTNSSTAINSIPALTLMGNNNVGIGTTTPSASLEISSSTASNLLNIKGTGGSGLLFVSSSGNVGIGTISPSYLLDVSGSSRHGYTSTNIHQFTGSVNLNGSLFTNANITASNISASGTGSFGAVGIGTTNIVEKLTVNGNVRLENPGYIYIYGRNGSGNNGCLIYQNGTGQNAGFAEIATSTWGLGYWPTLPSVGPLTPYIQWSTSTETIKFRTVNADRVIIDSNGNIGIGTTSPAYLLDVSGSSRFGFTSTNTHQFTGSVNISGSTTFSGPIIYKNAVLLDYGSTSTPSTSTNYAVLQNLTGSYNSAFFDYFASSGSNFRAGTVIAGWSGSSINYTEYATTDTGNTNQLSMSVDLSGSYVRLLTSVSTTTNWNIKSSGRYL